MSSLAREKPNRRFAVGVGLAVLALSSFCSAVAADFRLAQDNTQPGVPILYMSGEIRAGDRDKLVNLLRSDLRSTPSITNIWMNSPGGDLTEAIKIGAVVENLGYAAIVPAGATCASACFFIWVSASGRLAPGEVIIHRPYFDMSNSSQSASGFEERYRTTSEAASLYLRQRNVPFDLVDLLLRVSSSEGYVLSEADKLRIGPMSAARTEYMVQNCGLPGASESSRIMAGGGLSPDEQRTLRECSLRFYERQKREFFFGNVEGTR